MANTYRTIEVRKSTPHIGAEIFGVDLSKPLSAEQFEDVHGAFMELFAEARRDTAAR